jgi:ribonucleoside-triphosphate reductase
MTQTVVYTFRTRKLAGPKPTGNLLPCSIVVKLPKWDVSGVRPAGATLRTFGGRASGPEPLEDLFRFTVEVFRGAAGRRLSSIECHDLCCKIAQIVVVGGVRRSALISLSNLTDDRIRRCKSGQWWVDNPQRGLANNSACYTEKPDFPAFLDEWKSLYESYSGERGMFSRVASQKQAAKTSRRDATYDFGTNPCSEIILRPYQFCNLSEVVVRPTDSLADLKRKVRVATILGTLQATLTDFRYLRKIWKTNTEEEALLGVSLTGIMDHPCCQGEKTMRNLRSGLRRCVKKLSLRIKNGLIDLGLILLLLLLLLSPPVLSVSLWILLQGIHPRYAQQYIRRVRGSADDPLCACARGCWCACRGRCDVTQHQGIQLRSEGS